MKRFYFIVIIALIAGGLFGVVRFFGGADKAPLRSELFKGEGSEQGGLAPRRVVFIVVDTLRADHLPFYGYPKDTAPFLSTLANRAVVFDRVYSGSSHTTPSMGSVFTSLYPSQHTVITGMQTTKHLLQINPQIELEQIPSSLTTLGEYLKQAGYATFGVSDNFNISSEQGFTRGFDKFKTYKYLGAPEVNRTVVEWEQEINSNPQVALYVHYMDPHAPYHERAPWFRPSDNRRERTVNAYDSEINFTDQHIRELFERFNFFDDTLVIFLADHGEEFWEHGGYGHGKTLYNEVIHVPLMIYHEKLKPTRIDTPVSLVDVLPTLLDLLGSKQLVADRPGGYKTLFPGQFAGRSLLPLIDGSAKPEWGQDRPLFSQLLRRPEHPRPAVQSVLEHDYHLISTAASAKNKASLELYELANDPKESVDLFGKAEDKDTVEALRLRLEELRSQSGKYASQKVVKDLDDQSVKALRSLGYIE